MKYQGKSLVIEALEFASRFIEQLTKTLGTMK